MCDDVHAKGSGGQNRRRVNNGSKVEQCSPGAGPWVVAAGATAVVVPKWEAARWGAVCSVGEA